MHGKRAGHIVTRHATVSLPAAAALALALHGCAYIAVHTAPTKVPVTTRSEQALQADTLFWTTLHDGNYDGIPAALERTTAAYLATPGDATTAAHVGFLHIWRLAERARLAPVPPGITDDAVLARKYFQEAVALDPDDARYLGFLGASLLAEGTIHQDDATVRHGYYTLRAAIDAWPEFNLFTAGYVMSGAPPGSSQFQEALAWQWRDLDLCAGTAIDRRHPDFAPYMSAATASGPKRVCWNSWSAPHNFEGFFLNMGDMLVKAGDWQTAQVVYGNARLSPAYMQWPWRPALEARILRARENVAAFGMASSAGQSDATMFQSRFACVACHQR